MHITHQEQDQQHTAFVVAEGARLAMVLVERATGAMRAEAVGGASDADCALFADEAKAWLSAALWRACSHAA
jgi:hypothetical protein